MKIGVVYGNPETTTGGKSTAFYASIRLDVRRIGDVVDKEGNIVGARIRIQAPKNKTAPARRKVELELNWNTGFDKELDYVNFGVTFKFITKESAKSSWMSYRGKKLQGANAFAEYFRTPEGQEDYAALRAQVDAELDGNAVAILPDEDMGVTNAPEIVEA
jgi:recombination protein RecA